MELIKDEKLPSETKEIITQLKDQSVTKLDLLELEKLTPDELANLQSAAQKNRNKLDTESDPDARKSQEKFDLNHLQKIEEIQAMKINQLDDEGRKTLQREAMAKLSTEELELLTSIDPNLRAKILKLEPK